MSSLLEHCHGEKTHFSRNEKERFSLSPMNKVELVQTLSWRENALFKERKRTVRRCLKTNRALAPIGSLYCLGFNISEIERSLLSL